MRDAPLLRAEGLAYHYGARLGCRDVDLARHEGEILAVVGESGPGKSTLPRLLATELRPDAGRVSYRMRDGALQEKNQAGCAVLRIVHDLEVREALAGCLIDVSAFTP